MTDDDLYGELRAIAQMFRDLGQEVERRLTPTLRDEAPDWLLERLDAAVRASLGAAGDVVRFIREDRAAEIER